MSGRWPLGMTFLVLACSVVGCLVPTVLANAQTTHLDSTVLSPTPSTQLLGSGTHTSSTEGTPDQFDRAAGLYRDTITLLQIVLTVSLTVFAILYGIIYFVVPHQQLKGYERRIQTVEARIDQLRINVESARMEAQNLSAAFTYYALGVAGALQNDDQTKRMAFSNFVLCMKTTATLPASVYLKQLYAGSLGFIESMRHIHWTTMNQTIVAELRLVLDAMVSRLGWGNDAELMLQIASVRQWLDQPTAATASIDVEGSEF